MTIPRPCPCSRSGIAGLVLLAAAIGTPSAAAAPIDATWLGGNGNWTDANWAFAPGPAAATYPDNDATDFFSVLVDGDGATASTVTLDDSVAIDRLLLNADDRVHVDNGILEIVQDPGRILSGIVSNAGTIELSATGGGTAALQFTGMTQLLDGGSVILGGDVDRVVWAPDDVDTFRTNAMISGSGMLTNVDNRIAGSGYIGVPDLTNLAGGVIDADQAGAALVMAAAGATAPTTNLGIMEASDGGILRLFFGDYIQDTGGPDTGTIRALAGSTVQVENSGVDVHGGSLATVDDGEMLVHGGVLRLHDTAIDNAGSLRVGADSNGPGLLEMDGNTFTNSGTVTVDNASIDLSGTVLVDNSGQMTFTATDPGPFTHLDVHDDVTLHGGGELRFAGDATVVVWSPDDVDSFRADAGISGNGTLTNVDNRIAGSGYIGVPDLTNLAGGVIDADQAGAALVMAAAGATAPTTNLGIMEASDGGILRLFFGDYIQDTGGPDTGTIRALAGSTVQVENSGVDVHGGSLATVDDGEIFIRNGLLRLHGVMLDNDGTVQVRTGSIRGSFLQVMDSHLDGGLFAVDATSTMRTDGASSIDGITVDGSLSNVGMLSVGPGGASITGSYQQTAGATSLDGATLEAGTVLVAEGSLLAGNGTVAGDITIAGTAAAGSSTGILNFLGDASFSGIIDVEIAGAAVDGAVAFVDRINTGADPLTTAFDQYNIFGQAVLADGLVIDVTSIDGFVPMAGEFFDIITADSLVVDLDAIILNLPLVPGGPALTASIVSVDGRDALRLRVHDTTAVPAPATLLLVLAAIALGGASSRRRHPRRA